MSKRLKNKNGSWYVIETLPLEAVIENLSGNPTFKLETVDNKPRISFTISLPHKIGFEPIGYNEYDTARVVSQLSSNHTYWGTKIWVFSEANDMALQDLATTVLESQKPDVYRISDFNEIVQISETAQHYGGIMALSKKYKESYEEQHHQGYRLESVTRSNDPNKSAPLISVKGTYMNDVAIEVKLDIFNGEVSTKYRHFKNDRLIVSDLPPIWGSIRKKLLGSNSDPNSIANSLRIAMFLDDHKKWSETHLIGELISLIDLKTCDQLKNVV